MPSTLDVLTESGPSAFDEALLDGADERFRRLTEAANDALRRGDAAAAALAHQEASEEAARLFDDALAGGSPFVAPMAHTIACCNRADLAKRDGDCAGALALKRLAVEKLVATAESATAPLALRMNCARHLVYALAFLAEDLEDANADQRRAVGLMLARCRSARDQLTRIASRLRRPEADTRH